MLQDESLVVSLEAEVHGEESASTPIQEFAALAAQFMKDYNHHVDEARAAMINHITHRPELLSRFMGILLYRGCDSQLRSIVNLSRAVATRRVTEQMSSKLQAAKLNGHTSVPRRNKGLGDGSSFMNWIMKSGKYLGDAEWPELEEEGLAMKSRGGETLVRGVMFEQLAAGCKRKDATVREAFTDQQVVNIYKKAKRAVCKKNNIKIGEVA